MKSLEELARELDGVIFDVVHPEGARFDWYCLQKLMFVRAALFDMAKKEDSRRKEALEKHSALSASLQEL